MNFRSLLLLVALGLLGYFAWQKFSDQQPTEPPPRLTPEGVLIVIQRFSTPIPGGLHGFPIGKEVRMIGEDGDSFVVTDGKIEGRAPKDHFTNNLDEADKITAADRKKRQAYDAKRQQATDQQHAAKDAMDRRQKESEIMQLEKQREQLQIRTQELQLEEDKLQTTIQTKGRYEGITDLSEVSEKNKQAIAQNVEAIQRLELKVRRLRAELANR